MVFRQDACYESTHIYITTGSGRIDSIVKFIIDGYPFDQFHLLANHFKQYPFKFFYKLECLDLLPALWEQELPGKVVVLNTVTAEITVSNAIVHPEAQSARVRAGQPPGVEAGGAANAAIILSDCLAGPGWRVGLSPSLDGLTSADLGIIRREREVISEASIPNAVTRVQWGEGRKEIICGGVGLRAKEALSVARCEAVERYQIIFRSPASALEYGSYAELSSHAVDPLSLFFRMPQLSAEGGRDNYDPSFPMYWTWARNLITGEDRLVPAQEIWFSTERLPGESICVSCTTNALASGRSAEEAVLFAILEAIERDAFLTTWYLRRPCDKIAPESVRFEPFQLLWERMRAAFKNYSIHLFDISTDIQIPAVAAIAVREKGSGAHTLVAGAARPLAERALFASLKDLAAQLNRHSKVYERELYERFLYAPEQVITPEDHRSLYTLDEVFDQILFIGFKSIPEAAGDLNSRSVIKKEPSYNLRLVVEAILNHLAELGLEVFLVDVTHPMFSNQGYRCIKAIIPGLFPLWFGYRNARFSLTERLRRLSHNFTGRALQDESDVNLGIHPYS